jgi:murein DD-endopeptidase MepM/ murein hydrolase activator NlpD
MKRNTRISLIVFTVILQVGIAAWFLIPRFEQNYLEGGLVDSSSFAKPVARLYGLAMDSFNIETNVVQRDQNLGKILSNYTLPERAFTQLMMYASQVFDLRKIRGGNHYTAFLSKDTAYQLKYMVYEHSPIEYVVFDFTDSVRVTVKQKEIITRQKRVSGEIATSLWDAITKNNINPVVALELSEMYAWTVDFFGLQSGDNFTVVYDEMYVDTVSIGIGKIYAASFTHAGKERLAIPFTQDNQVTYYDADGNSLRRAFLKAPLRFSRISSRFSGSRMHPVLKIRRPHYGVDYAAPIGTPVYAIGDGRVTMANYQGGAGRMVKVRHNGVYTSTYMHLSAFGKGITPGKYVMQGELLGYVGSSGLSTGPHLDFRVFRNGSPIDPLKMESPTVDPIKPVNKTAFESVKIAAVEMLNSTDQPKVAQTIPPASSKKGLDLPTLMPGQQKN